MDVWFARETTTGGKALKFRLLRRIETLKGRHRRR